MKSTSRHSFFVLLNAFITPSLGQQFLTACPTDEIIVQDSTGNSWASCPKTDYAWDSLSWVGGVKNDADCASYCTNTKGCAKAVYDRQYGWCHAKADVNNGLWRQNDAYDAIRPYSGPITSCPTKETNFTDGKGRIWAVCQFSGKHYPTQPDVLKYSGYEIGILADLVQTTKDLRTPIRGA
jgi:hypothetical protein